MTVVHHFRVWNPSADAYVTPERKSPAERIERVRGEIIPGTAELVDRSQLDDFDRYDPRPKQ